MHISKWYPSTSSDFPHSHLVAQGGKDKGRPNLREAAKTKLPDESANFSEDGMESNHAPAPLPLIERNRAASRLESVSIN